MKPYSTHLLLAFCLLILYGMFATPLSAQTPTVPSVEAGKAWKLAADHNALRTTSYRVELNGTQVAEVPVSSNVAGVVTVDMAPLSSGRYDVVVIARNAPTDPFIDPTETRSTVYTFEARAKAPAPDPPMWREIVIRMADGRRFIESITPVTMAEIPETLRLLADGTMRVER
jgi:hypothetical protein